MTAHVRHPLTEVSDNAAKVYSLMVKHMNDSGYVDFEGCLEISVQSVKKSGDMKTIGIYLAELQSASLIFHSIYQSGWVVKLPPAPDLITSGKS